MNGSFQKLPRQRPILKSLLRDTVLARAGHRCQACGRGGRLDVHHVVKRSQGGSDWDLNALVALCRRCHEQIDAPFVRGRLIVTPQDSGRFGFEIVTTAVV